MEVWAAALRPLARRERTRLCLEPWLWTGCCGLRSGEECERWLLEVSCRPKLRRPRMTGPQPRNYDVIGSSNYLPSSMTSISPLDTYSPILNCLIAIIVKQVPCRRRRASLLRRSMIRGWSLITSRSLHQAVRRSWSSRSGPPSTQCKVADPFNMPNIRLMIS